MATPISILIFGQDSLLLSTRQWILATSGHSVRTTAHLPDVRQILLAEQIDLLILCHTLQSDDRDRALAFLKSRAMQRREYAPKHLILTAGISGYDEPLGEVLDAMEGPAQLVRKVRTMTQGEPLAAGNPRAGEPIVMGCVL
ncbi:hypothetical protein FTO74_17985 [Granulicella sp. WH15]|uniref:hypothetical protein n=1 Tax=Granulicella sp. WH15 TaxID=2602070 RepID=UPI00136766E6|nr:hypothetical protein [Granulicella sp. WH15]QHN05032.1 hypothetical protein FTO74_17985 [Granulicella sp. WH15]